MSIGFKLFREKFRTRVKLEPKSSIEVEYINGPFKYLNNHWNFVPDKSFGCFVEFHVDFEFKSKLMQKLMNVIFTEAMGKMTLAFEKRAECRFSK